MNQSLSKVASRISMLKASHPNPLLRAQRRIRPSRNSFACMAGESSMVTIVSSAACVSFGSGRFDETAGSVFALISASPEIKTSSSCALSVAALFNSASVFLMGRSFLVGLCDDSHRTGLDRPTHNRFPRAPGHATPCSAQTDLLGAFGRDSARHLRNAARPFTGRAQGRIGGRGLRGFSELCCGAAVHVCSVFFLPVRGLSERFRIFRRGLE
jgi:hypothetical protein